MAHASVILLWVAFLLYGAAFAVFVVGFFGRHPGLNRVGLVIAAVALVFHTAAIVTRGVDVGRLPFVGAYESLIMVAWSVALVWHVLESLTKMKAVGLYVMPVILALLTAALVAYKPSATLGPALRSDIVILHVGVMLTAIGCLYVAGGAGIIYLLEESMIKRHKLSSVLGRLPSLASLDRLVYHATLLGVPFLTAGMAAGVIRAVTYEVPHWWYDPLVLLSITAWAMYIALLYGRLRGEWGGGRIAWLALAGLVLLFVIRFAAVPYLSGFHNYGG